MVIWSDPARADCRSIHDFIAHDQAHYARKVAQDIADRAEALDDLPRLGKVAPELDDETIRELQIYSYRIIYEIRDLGIVILAVIHKRRDFQPELMERQARGAAVAGKLRADLEKTGSLIGPNDLLIAAHALTADATLVTHNTREFSRVKNLRLIDWVS